MYKCLFTEINLFLGGICLTNETTTTNERKYENESSSV